MKKSQSGRNSSAVSQDEDQEWLDSPGIEADHLQEEEVLFEDEEDEEAFAEFVEHMDIRQPLETLREILQAKVEIPLDNFTFWLQNTSVLEPSKNLVDQCIQGEGLVQINCQINPKAQIITVVDILKPTDDVLANSSSGSSDSPPRKPTKRTHDGSSVKSAVPVASKNKNWAIDNAFKREQSRRQIPDNPVLWTKPHVRFWLQWAMRHFSQASIHPEDWAIDGEELSKITLEQFNEKVAVDPGNFFWTHLELLRKCKFVAVQQKSAPPVNPVLQNSAPKREKVARSSPALHLDSNSSSSEIKPINVMPRTSRGELSPANRYNGQIQLWQFLLDILTDVEHRDVIQWEGEEGQFKLLDAERVAQLWGIRKNKPNMNYEKLSRALRYYYDGDMLAKVAGKRFVYQFVCNLQNLIGYTPRELANLVNENS